MSEQKNGDRPGYWAILELMGHVSMAGFVTEEERIGTVLGRIDIANDDGEELTQFFSGSSIYRRTPCTEATARAFMQGRRPVPFSPFDFRRALPEPVDESW